MITQKQKVLKRLMNGEFITRRDMWTMGINTGVEVIRQLRKAGYDIRTMKCKSKNSWYCKYYLIADGIRRAM